MNTAHHVAHVKSKDGSKRSRKKPTVTDAGENEDAVKEEDPQEVEEIQVEGVSEPEPPSSGDVPILDEDAEKILEVLETCVP